MTDLYGQISTALENILAWGQWQDPEKLVVRAIRPIPRYALITEEDLESAFVENVPADALQDRSLAVGKMAQCPCAVGTILKNEEVLSLPAVWPDVVITAIAVPQEKAPQGLIPGDLIVIYAYQKDGCLLQLNASLIVAMQNIASDRNKQARADQLHLTLAIPSADGEALASILNAQISRIIRLNSQKAHIPSAQNIRSVPQITTSSTSPLVDNAIIHQLELQYEEGERWFRQLQAGINLKIPDHLQTLHEAFSLLENARISSDASSSSKDRLEEWRRQVNDYRNKWIRLLQNAFNEMQCRVDQNQKAFLLYYPSTLEKVAPTAIGNVFRAADSYCDMLYGLDSALVLPRLQAVMEQSIRTQLSKAHAQLAQLEWLYLGSVSIGLIGTLLALFSHHYLLALLLWFLVFPIPQLFIYAAAVSSALDYAAALRLAVDCERGKVISMLGFSPVSPTDQEQEKALWKRIQQWWVYGASPANDTTIANRSESNEKDT